MESARREIQEATRRPAPRPLQRTPTDLRFTPERLEELEEMGGPDAYRSVEAPLGMDLLGDETVVIAINLQDAVTRAVRHNLNVQTATLGPAISEAQVVAAEAAFDWSVFGGVDLSRIDQPSVVPAINGVPIGSSINRRNAYGFDTGIRRRLESGGRLDISQRLEITDNQSPNVSLSPDPARLASLDITLGQPLLRGFGSDVNLAEVHLARNLERDAIQTLRQTLIDTVTQTERAYWSLYLAHHELHIRQRLLDRGIETRDVLEGRLDFDVKPAEYSDAVARVESRRADVIRAANVVRLRSDELKAIINDPELTVGNELVLTALDRPIDASIEFSLLDSITTALGNRPDIQRSVLLIDDASIRQRVADNARLPILDLTLQTRFTGLDDSVDGAYREIGEATFVDMLLGLAFEMPIGNRGPEAALRQRRLERTQAVINYRAAVQNAVVEVKAALRNLTTSYQLIEQTRASRLAAAENLRTLLVEEEALRALTPDFLDLKFRRQEALAIAELQEIQSLADYSISLAELYSSVGAALERNRIRFVVPNPGEDVDRRRQGSDDHVSAGSAIDVRARR